MPVLLCCPLQPRNCLCCPAILSFKRCYQLLPYKDPQSLFSKVLCSGRGNLHGQLVLLVDDFAAISRCCPEFWSRTTKNWDWTLWILVRPSGSKWMMDVTNAWGSWCVCNCSLHSLLLLDLPWLLFWTWLCSHGSCTQHSSHLQRQWPVRKHKDCRDCREHPAVRPDLSYPIGSVSSFGCANSEMPLGFMGLHRSSPHATQQLNMA